MTTGVDSGAMSELIRSGISGVFRKHDSATLLAQGIRDVMAGKVWLDQEQLQTATNEVTASQTGGTRPFTERERRVLSFVFDGLANKEIAARIGVSEARSNPLCKGRRFSSTKLVPDASRWTNPKLARSAG